MNINENFKKSCLYRKFLVSYEFFSVCGCVVTLSDCSMARDVSQADLTAALEVHQEMRDILDPKVWTEIVASPTRNCEQLSRNLQKFD